MVGRQQIESFIGSSFRSVWALDVLKFLASHRGSSFSAPQLVAALRASNVVVAQSLDNLAAAGLVVIDEEGLVSLYEGSPEEAALVQGAIDFYARSPDKVRRLIIAQTAPGVTAFADAFRFRKD